MARWRHLQSPRTVSVDSFEPNPWGLYNVHGNVWEWTEDCSNDSNYGNPGDGRPRMKENCDGRIVRGGSWDYAPRFLRSANRPPARAVPVGLPGAALTT